MLSQESNIAFADESSFELFEEKLYASISKSIDEKEWVRVKETVLNNEAFKIFFRLYTTESISNYDLYGGCFFQEAAKSLSDASKINYFLNLSHTSYTNFQKMAIENNDINYFVQWQKGIVEDKLGYNWQQVERTLVDSSQYYPARGEAIQHIIQHYRTTMQEGIGYIFSSMARDMFYGKLPAGSRWFTNHSFYNWRVLYHHAAICRQIKNQKEEATTLKQIKVCLESHPDFFSEDEKKRFINIL